MHELRARKITLNYDLEELEHDLETVNTLAGRAGDEE
jgi:predicted HTH domain antitoxin